MTEAIRRALQRAERPLDWNYPCLVWVAEYLEDAGAGDILGKLRGKSWDEQSGRRWLLRLGRAGAGETPVERVLDAVGRDRSWVETDAIMQGAVMVGIVRGLNAEGSPAIFDGRDRWILGRQDGGFRTTDEKPARIWEVPSASVA